MLCAAMHLKDLRRMSNLREDTLGQVLSNANVSAGRRVLMADGGAMGVVTAGCMRRMGGYGSVISLFNCAAESMHPGYCEGVVDQMNLAVLERQSLRWVNLAEVFCDRRAKARQMESLRDAVTGKVADVEQQDRERIAWPAPLHPHTRDYVKTTLVEERKVEEFLAGRSARFAPKLTRHSALELRALVDECCNRSKDYEYQHHRNAGSCIKGGEEDATDGGRAGHDGPQCRNGEGNGERDASSSPQQCDLLIIATKYNPTAT
jgi:hypothetical protein